MIERVAKITILWVELLSLIDWVHEIIKNRERWYFFKNWALEASSHLWAGARKQLPLFASYSYANVRTHNFNSALANFRLGYYGLYIAQWPPITVMLSLKTYPKRSWDHMLASDCITTTTTTTTTIIIIIIISHIKLITYHISHHIKLTSFEN